MSMSTFPDLSLQLSKNSTAYSGGAAQNALSSPFAFDNSGWNVSLHSSGAQSAAGASGQGAGAAGAGLGGMLSAINPRIVVLAALAYLILKRA